MRVVSAIINDIYTDQRVRKQAAVLKSLNCDVTIACRRQSDHGSGADDDFHSVKFTFPVNHGPLFYFLYNMRLFSYLLFHRFDVYVANDLDTLLPCFLLSRIRNKPLVYDSHEYFTGQHGLDHNRLAYKTWKRIERYILPKLRYMITVSESIAQLYFSEYGILPVVVRNLSFSSKQIKPFSRYQAGIPEDDFLVVLQGTGLNPGRGAIELLDAMKLTEGVHLMIIGSGDSIEEIKTKSSGLSVKHKVTFVPRMPWEEMMSYTKMCDAGLSLDKDQSINQRYSLPNKLFDYLSAGIPVIVSPLPEIEAIVSQYNCGLVTDDVTPVGISKALLRMRDDSELRSRLKEGAKNASQLLTWDDEKQKEISLFKTLLSDVTGRSH